MNCDYPLRFKPILRRYLWGGRRLETVLGKPLPPGNDYAESWELVDHGADQSVVRSGPLGGATLHELVCRHGPALLGRHAPQPQFPLLFKFLDAQKYLSVQVHPNDEQAACLSPPDHGKTEAWVVLHAEPGSRIYAGLKPGVDRTTLRDAIAAGTAEQCLHGVQPSVGDCLLIPAGTVHALGAGLVIAEIQQSSDTTYRLYDWNRVGPDGQPRRLHVEEALAVIDFEAGPVSPRSAESASAGHVQRLVTCDKFVVDRRQLDAPHSIAGDQRCHLLVPLQGSLNVERDAAPAALRPGQTSLVPAAAGPLRVSPRDSATLLDIYLPLP
ncbi:MAG: type I phosphomannose isomerase catalytic subunit [Planctomycetota bacterium]